MGIEYLRTNMDPPLWDDSPTVSDTVDLGYQCVAIVSDTAGDVKVTQVDDSTTVLTLVAGMPRPCRVTRVWATGGDSLLQANLECAKRLDE